MPSQGGNAKASLETKSIRKRCSCLLPGSGLPNKSHRTDRTRLNTELRGLEVTHPSRALLLTRFFRFFSFFFFPGSFAFRSDTPDTPDIQENAAAVRRSRPIFSRYLMVSWARHGDQPQEKDLPMKQPQCPWVKCGESALEGNIPLTGSIGGHPPSMFVGREFLYTRFTEDLRLRLFVPRTHTRL